MNRMRCTCGATLYSDSQIEITDFAKMHVRLNKGHVARVRLLGAPGDGEMVGEKKERGDA